VVINLRDVIARWEKDKGRDFSIIERQGSRGSRGSRGRTLSNFWA
jgi:hypothetical protein